jgi:hypothetical protein
MSVAVPASSGQVAIYSYPFKSLDFRGIAFANPQIAITESTGPNCDGKTSHGTIIKKPNDGNIEDHDYRDHNLSANVGSSRCYGGSDITLGAAEFRHLHVLFSFKENMLYITPADVGK